MTLPNVSTLALPNSELCIVLIGAYRGQHRRVEKYHAEDKIEGNSNVTACFKNVNNCLNTNICSYLETSGGHSYNLFLNCSLFQHQS